MKTLTLKTNLHCDSCISKIEPILKSNDDISNFSIDLNHKDKIITIESDDLNLNSVISEINGIVYSAELTEDISIAINQENKSIIQDFWNNIHNWKRASFNTLNCLIGCSIGDFGMIIFLQAFYPSTSMFWQMTLAIMAGLSTSVALETMILKKREKFSLPMAFKTALSMSFISMIGMEIAMNTTDFLITGGKAAFNTFGYWMALFPSMIAGFILPLPYNYYKLQKFGMSCH